MKRIKLYLLCSVIFLFLTRIILRIYLPNTFYVPDEATWSRLTTWIHSGGDNTFFEGFDSTPYFGAQALILPSTWQVTFLNISSLEAVRNTSLIYGFGSIILFALMILLLYQIRNSNKILQEKNEMQFPILALIIYGLVPSHALWAVVGLRDSAAEFFVMLIILFIQYSFHQSNKRFASTFFIAIGLIGLSTSRVQVAWIMCLLLIVSAIVSIIMKQRRYEFIAIAIIAFPISYFLGTPPEVTPVRYITLSKDGEQLQILIERNKVASIKSKELILINRNGNLYLEKENSEYNSSEKQSENTVSQTYDKFGRTLSGENLSIEALERLLAQIDIESNMINSMSNPKYAIQVKDNRIQIKNASITEDLTAPIDRLQKLEIEREAKRETAKGVIREISCPIILESSFGNLSCEIFRLPFTMSTFLFRPFFFEPSSSQQFKYASVENILWFILCLLLLIIFFVKRKSPRMNDLPSILFLVLFVPPASLTEGNFGTAVRHKSVTLWAFLLLLLSLNLDFSFKSQIALRKKSLMQ